MEVKNVAFVGLGVMGYPMAGYLSKAGYNTKVFNRTLTKAAVSYTHLTLPTNREV